MYTRFFSKIPKILNFSLTQNEHEISAILELPSPTSPVEDLMDFNPFRYTQYSGGLSSKSVEKCLKSVYNRFVSFFPQLFGQRRNIASSWLSQTLARFLVFRGVRWINWLIRKNQHLATQINFLTKKNFTKTNFFDHLIFFFANIKNFFLPNWPKINFNF